VTAPASSIQIATLRDERCELVDCAALASAASCRSTLDCRPTTTTPPSRFVVDPTGLDTHGTVVVDVGGLVAFAATLVVVVDVVVVFGIDVVVVVQVGVVPVMALP